MRNVVIISRNWHKPKISMVVSDEGISFMMDLLDFRDAIKMELAASNGNIQKIDEAFEAVIRGIKSESVSVV